MLYDARRLFDSGSARADDVLRSIVCKLPEAVRTCLDAALAEHDVLRQRALLKVLPGSTLPHVLMCEAC